MRRALFTLIAASGVMVFAGCENFLEVSPRNIISREGYFQTEQHMEEAVVNIYSTTQGMFGNNYRLVQELRGDLVTLQLNINVPGFTFQIDEFSEATNDGTISGQYSSIFNTIFDANVVLSRIDAIEFTNPARKEELRAQALYARALAYWLGMQLWGLGESWQPGNLAIPMALEEIQNPDEAFTLARGTVQETFNLIVADLNAAIPHLPLKSNLSAADARRFTRGAAIFLLGATYQLDPAPGMQQQALAQFIELENQGYALVTAGTQESGNNAYRQVFNPAIRFSNPESILQFSGGALSAGNIAPLNAGGTTNATRVQITGNGGGSFMPTQFHVLSYAGADPSKPATPFDLRYEGGYGAFCPGSGQNGRLNNITDQLRTAGDISLRSPNPVYPEINTASLRDPVNKTVRSNCVAFFAQWRWPDVTAPDRIIFRYADVLLRRAEALARLNRPAEALVFVNQIRARAGLPALSGLSGQALLDAILQERAWELAGEGHRWTDLKRFGKAVAIIAGPHAADRFARISRTPPAAYMVQGSTYRTRFPIDPDDVRLSKCLILQNPGWAAECVGT